jgi:hypothetical protein
MSVGVTTDQKQNKQTCFDLINFKSVKSCNNDSISVI